MPKRKSHIWIADKKVKGLSRCQRCGISKFDIPGQKIVYSRGDKVDNSPTRTNCFILSKE